MRDPIHIAPDEATLAQRALDGLRDLYRQHELDDVSPDSAADQCATLYELLNSLGMEVA